MALDRQSIARRDFPSNRRGYDPSAVDAHLAQIAEEVEALQRRAATPAPAPAPLSAQAGEQVKAIVEAAERGAQEIRDGAQAEAREHVARVTAAADTLRDRIEQMERDVTQLVLDLRTNAERLRTDLAALAAGTGELREAAAAPAPAAAAEPPAAAPKPAAAAGPPAAAPEPPAPAEPAPAAPEPVAPAAKNGDPAAARIVALDMALSGTPRDETERYLAEHYELPDRESLLDEVYAAAGA